MSIYISQNFSTCLLKNLELQIIHELFLFYGNIFSTWCLKLFRVEYTVLFHAWCFLALSTSLIKLCLVSLNLNYFSQNSCFCFYFLLYKVKTESSKFDFRFEDNSMLLFFEFASHQSTSNWSRLSSISSHKTICQSLPKTFSLIMISISLQLSLSVTALS